jgi:hypothetical protein
LGIIAPYAAIGWPLSGYAITPYAGSGWPPSGNTGTPYAAANVEELCASVDELP